jgi:hypothetical protein
MPLAFRTVQKLSVVQVFVAQALLPVLFNVSAGISCGTDRRKKRGGINPPLRESKRQE